MFSNFMAINLAWLSCFISPNSLMFHMPSRITNQTEEATAEKLVEKNIIIGEEIKGCHYIVHNYSSVSEGKYGLNSLICCTLLSVSVNPFKFPF